jgi:hypothetical protein
VQTRATGGVEVWTALGMQEERAVTLAANSFFFVFSRGTTTSRCTTSLRRMDMTFNEWS